MNPEYDKTEGKALLEELIDEATEDLKHLDQEIFLAGIEEQLGAGFMPYLTTANADGAFIKEVEDGWMGEIVLFRAPAGSGNIIGTPDASPRKNLEGARQDALYVVKILVANSSRYPALPEEPAETLFNLSGITLSISPEAIAAGRDVLSQTDADVEAIVILLHEKLKEDFGESKPNEERFLHLDLRRRQIYTMLAGALAANGMSFLPPGGAGGPAYIHPGGRA